MARKKKVEPIEPFVKLRFPAHVELHQAVPNAISGSERLHNVLSATVENDKVRLAMSDGYGGKAWVTVHPGEMVAWCVSLLAELGGPEEYEYTVK